MDESSSNPVKETLRNAVCSKPACITGVASVLLTATRFACAKFGNTADRLNMTKHAEKNIERMDGIITVSLKD